MSLTLAVRLFEVLLGLSLALQTLEHLRLPALDRIMLWSRLQAEIPAKPAWLNAGVIAVLQPVPYKALLCLRLLLSVVLMAGYAGTASAALLFVLSLLLLLRWRGAFNGGSDFMSLVGVSGLLLAHIVGVLSNPAWGWHAGLWFISLQTVSSYFVSGWVKLMRPEWRTGQALTHFLDTGVYGPLTPNSLFRQPQVAWACAWSFTLWEGLFPLALLDARLAMTLCAVATVFHFLVFWFFSLNRFFWAWISSFPAIIYCAGSAWS